MSPTRRARMLLRAVSEPRFVSCNLLLLFLWVAGLIEMRR
jgi:hypothetical protein